MTTVTERAAAGAAFLDEHDPDWWRADVERAIDLGKLCLGNGDQCILGQRCPLEYSDDWSGYGLYSAELSGLPLSDWRGRDDWAVERGFQAQGDGPAVEFADLDAEWRRVIEARRAS